MNSKGKDYWLRALVLAEGFCVIDVIVVWMLGLPWRSFLADAMFFEGAILFMVSGIIDLSRSITFTHIRGRRKYRPTDPPPHVKPPGKGYILFIAGLLLCSQAVLIIYVLPATGVRSP